jgi:hypothetical protein
VTITTKWPTLIVTGKPVTPVAAAEILVRTDDWGWMGAGDDPLRRAIQDVAADFGWPRPPERQPMGPEYAEYDRLEAADEDRRYHDQLDAWATRIGAIDLKFLANRRLYGGAGWCRWDGHIGCVRTIGKYPQDSQLTHELVLIAAAFPFLDLQAQVVDNDGPVFLAAEWRIQGGTVTYNQQQVDSDEAPPPRWPHTVRAAFATVTGQNPDPHQPAPG